MDKTVRSPAPAGAQAPRNADLAITSKNNAPANANQELPFHPLADIFPLMEGAEFEELVADIKAHALRTKITLHEGKILDGRNRYRAMLAAGHTPRSGHFFKYKSIVSGDTPLDYVIRANLHRRHLTAEQKREIIAKLLKAQPEKSDREIGRMTKADHHKVAKIRKEQESTGEISPVEKRTGADGKARKQPAKKSTPKPPATPKPTKRDDRVISQAHAEQVGRLAYQLVVLDADLARKLAGLLLQPGVSTRLWNDLTTMLSGAVIDDGADGDAAS